jgi:iron(III) transport system substrate-binding protein
LWKGEVEDLFAPVQSPALLKAVPEHLRAKQRPEGTRWFGLSTRARVIVYDKQKFKPEDVDSYEKLADPKFAGRLCIRSGSHPYNLSLFGAMLEHLGAPATETWLKGLVANLARQPKGGDTDQIKGVASGECGVALANSYYLARLYRSDNPQDKAVVERIGVMFPNQATWGTHVNIAGGAVARHAKHPQNAVAFLNYLASDQAQTYFADGNNEWPVIKGLRINNPALKAMGGDAFKSEKLAASVVGMNQVKVQQMLDRVGLR